MSELVPGLSILVVARNEERQIADCLNCLTFGAELVVVLDRSTDRTAEIAKRYTDKVLEVASEREGGRRNFGIAACTGPWILEIDADERVPPELVEEIRLTLQSAAFDRYLVPVDNYIGQRLVRFGWGASFGKSAYPGLFRKGTKVWGDQRVHPKLTLTGRQGPPLRHPIQHLVDRDISDMMQRLDRYTTLRAQDLRDSGEIGSYGANLRRIFSRFYKCYVRRKGYREGPYGFVIALFAGLFPILSYLKARLDLTESNLH